MLLKPQVAVVEVIICRNDAWVRPIPEKLAVYDFRDALSLFTVPASSLSVPL